MDKKQGKKSDALVVFLIKAILVLGFIAFVVFWVYGCVGNFLNADENPAPTLF